MYSFKFFASASGFPPPVSVRDVAAKLGFAPPIPLRGVMTVPRPPQLISPIGIGDGSGSPIQQVSLTWRDPGIANYNQAATFNVILFPGDPRGTPIPQIISPATSYLIPYNLFYDFTYAWSVQGVNDHGASAMSSINFNTRLGPPPTRLEPNNREDVAIPVSLTWIDPGAKIGSPALEFEIEITGLFTDSSTKTFKTQQTNFTVPQELFPANRYHWKVRGHYPPPDSITGTTAFSELANFQTVTG
jgi:hypothetical protein